MNISQVIKRLQAASRGDRDLDADIYAALGYRVRRIMGAGRRSWVVIPSHESYWQSMDRPTTSLDDAVRLLPSGWRVESLQFGGTIAERDYCHCELGRDYAIAGRDLSDDEIIEMAANNLATAPLAICVAALKARLVS